MTFLTILLTSSLVMSIIMMLLLGFSLVSRTAITARARYVMWIILLIGLVIPFRPILGKGLITVADPWQPKTTEESITYIDNTAEGAEQPVVEPQTPAPAPAPEQNTPITSRLTASQIVFAVWAIGAIALFGKYMIEYYKFQRIVKRWGVPVTDEITLETFEWTKARMGLEDKNIRLITCNTISTPMLTGLFKPTILLPDKDIGDEEMELILEHELTHYKHKDLLINLLGITALCVHWFNPIVYLCFPAIYGDGESYCDETVLKNKDKDYRRFYGEVIISMIETSPAKPIALSTCFYAKKLSIKRRLYNIMETNKNMKNLSAASIATVLTLTMVSGSVIVFASPARKAKSNTIGAEKAKSIALKDAGLKANNVKFVRVKLDKDDGVGVYDVEFYSNGVEYDYEIDAKTGAILEKDKDIENYSIPNQNANPSNTQKNNQPSGSGQNSNKNVAGTVGVAKAKEIALRDAGLKSNQVAFVKAKLDNDDGVAVYDVEFYSNGVEYDYEIDAKTGAIREKDKDIEDYSITKKNSNANNTSSQNANNNDASNKNASSSNSKGAITLGQAKDIALKNAGLKSGQVTFVKSKMDTDNGVKVYDVEFYSNGVEYDFEIDATTGAIREKDKDIENYSIPKQSNTSSKADNDKNDKNDDDDDNDNDVDNDSDDTDRDDD
ncbi:MAG: M56 family metallopeptidase [Peptostreptococcaceae bacterium]|nr:M56 family metallopeptidase [Peptostreptococcaceae bacterium]